MVGVADFFDDGGKDAKVLLRRQVQLQSCQSILHQNVVCQLSATITFVPFNNASLALIERHDE